MLNIEGMLREHLQEQLQVPCYTEIPPLDDPATPARFVTVERTGGGERVGPIGERVTVAVDYWAGKPPQGRAAAFALARQGDKVMNGSALHRSGIADCATNALAHFPDPVSGRDRYEGTYNLTTYEYPEE